MQKIARKTTEIKPARNHRLYPPHLCALFRPFSFLVVWAHSLAIIMTVVVSLPQTVARRHRLHTNNSNYAIPMHTHIFIYAIYIWYHIHSTIFYAIATIKRKSITTLKGGWRMLWNSLWMCEEKNWFDFLMSVAPFILDNHIHRSMKFLM